ncbi:MAG: hypothetical protein KF773_20435 [Deltaproteobacteria bacterium]|nr:hypothetical protein [Deltaproteobacteria bacterium]
MRISFVAVALAAAAGCGTDPEEEPVDPSAAARFRGYAAVQDELYAKFIAPGTPFELFRYLGPSGEELSRLVGRPDGFGVTFDVRNARPNGMNVLVWRMMLRSFATDLAATCPGSREGASIELAPAANATVGALCAWPAVDNEAAGAAWDLVVGRRAPERSRAAFVQYARALDLEHRPAADALAQIWLGALLHPSFLLEQ